MRILRLFTTIAIVTFAIASQSQTVITYNNHSPQIGQTIVMKSLYGDQNPLNIDPGPAGANVTWNFAAYVGIDESTTTFINPAQTPFADSIAGTGINLAVAFLDEEDTGYAFFTSTQQNLTINSFGLMMEGAPIMYNSYDPAPVQMVFPFAFGDSYDTYGEMETDFEGYISLSKEWITVTADAWGTLTNPIGTFNNVLRLKMHSIDSTFTYFNGVLVYSDGYESFDYSWYSSTHRYMIQSIYGDLVDGDLEVWGIDYLVEESASVENPEFSKLKIYPNPASDKLFIEDGYGQFILSDMMGRKVLEINAHLGATGIDITSLPEGLYILHTIQNNQAVSSAKIMIKR